MMQNLPTRQVHLDFHNSPFIPGICSNFDADALADTFARAQVNSVTVFARCIHGMSYYPTKYGKQHPEMNGRNFLGEIIEALHRRGIRAPIYVTITWEQEVARMYPEWLQMYKDGRHGFLGGDRADPPMPGSKWILGEFLHPDYMDYIEGYLTEILTGYPVDGIFLDMLFYDRYEGRQSSWSPSARKFRKEHGIIGEDMEAHYRFEAAAQKFFSERMTGLIKHHHPNATVFYNTPTDYFIESDEGSPKRFENQTQVEVESLPSGEWGYFHFPKIARRLMSGDMPWLSMTGRFQKMWGDFGGIKPQSALEYECFRAQAMGGANSIGDQLLPDGTLDADAYSLIGAVYEQCEAAELFYQGSQQAPRVGVLTAMYPGDDREDRERSEEAVTILLGELRYEFVILDNSADLSTYELIVLPDNVVIDSVLEQRLKAYVESGGAMILSYRSGFDKNGECSLLNEMGLSIQGEAEMSPNYWLPVSGSTFDGLTKQERVFYEKGLEVEASSDWETTIERINPYFNRDDTRYTSHVHTPSSGIKSPYSACMRRGKVIYFADPIFLDYRVHGGLFVKQCFKSAIYSLIGNPLISGLKETVESYFSRKENDLLISLIHYIPYRKTVSIDIIEESQSFGGQTLQFLKKIDMILSYDNGKETALDMVDGHTCPLPPVDGRLLLRVPGYFN